MKCIELMDSLLRSMNFEPISEKKMVVEDIKESIFQKKKHNHITLIFDNKKKLISHGLNFFIYGKNINVHSEVHGLKKLLVYKTTLPNIHLVNFRFTTKDIRFSMPCSRCYKYICRHFLPVIKTLNYSVSSTELVRIDKHNILNLNCNHTSFYQQKNCR